MPVAKVTRELGLLMEGFAATGAWEALHDCLIECGFPDVAWFHFVTDKAGGIRPMPCSNDEGCDLYRMQMGLLDYTDLERYLIQHQEVISRIWARELRNRRG